MDLAKALDLGAGEMVSLVGGGGKTTVLYRLAGELYRAGMATLVTTTTKIFPPSREQCHFLYVEKERARLVVALRKNGPAPAIHVAGTEINRDGKLCGLPLEWFPALLQEPNIHHILVEADGAASRPLKVPLEHEPVIPAETGVVLILIGLDVLERPLSDAWVHRAERAAEILNVDPGTPVREEMIRALWRHPDGLTKGIPPPAKKIVILNKADTTETVETGLFLARALVAEGADKVLVASMRDEDPVKEVVVA
jgi:probable selenium-dependent hydroxylase accessory protein YqeC